MTKEELKKLIQVARGQKKADLVIKGAHIVDVLSGEIQEGDIAISGQWIAGVGDYSGLKEIDGKGLYAMPGLIDSHIHIESSYLSPEEFARMAVPHGTTTIIADPHEIVNVEGFKGFDYMKRAAARTPLDVFYNLPSCVPATPFEHSGATILAKDMGDALAEEDVPGLAELMNFVGVINLDDDVLDKVMLAKSMNKKIDGHAPGLLGKDLNAYACAGIVSDHEVSDPEALKAKIAAGIYVPLREGSACHDLENVLPGVTKENSRRCLLCSDDRQSKTLLEKGHVDDELQMCVSLGLDPMDAIRMATLNATEAWGLNDRGAICPGRFADIVLVDDLKGFHCKKVFKKGELVAEDGVYLPKVEKEDISPVKGSIRLKDFSLEKLKLHLKGNKVNAIKILPGGVLTAHDVVEVKKTPDGDFQFDSAKDLAKVAVIERHQGTGNVAVGILEGYGIQHGAIAVSIAHDSHNIIAVGVSNEEIYAAVEALKEQEGGMVLVKNGEVIASLPMPIAGLMSDQDGVWVAKRLDEVHQAAWEELGVRKDVEPTMTLTFMSLAVIPALKLTDEGLFDVEKFCFIPLEAE